MESDDNRARPAPADTPAARASGDRGQAGGLSEEPDIANRSPNSGSSRPLAGPSTESGTAAIEEAVAGLDELDTLPLAEHVARFDAVHVALNVALSTVDSPH